MAPTVPRLLSVDYGGFVVGGATDYHLDGRFQLEQEYGLFQFSVDVVITSDETATESSFATACDDLEEAFRKPLQSLTITNNGVDWFKIDPAANTGFLSDATVKKSAEEVDTGRSRKYNITVSGQLPADLAGFNGRRAGNISIAYSGSRIRAITFSGTYTAIGGNNALEQYEANAPAWIAGILSSLGGTYELSSENADPEHNFKVMTFQRVYREIIFNQASGTLDHPAIVNHIVTGVTTTLSEGDSPGSPVLSRLGWPYFTDVAAARPINIELEFNCDVDINETTGLSNLYQQTIRPYLIEQFGILAGTGTVIIEREIYQPTFTSNQITAKLIGIGLASSVLQHTMECTIDDQHGVLHQGVYSDFPLEKYKFQGERIISRICTQILLMLPGGLTAGSSPAAGAGGGSKPGFSLAGITTFGSIRGTGGGRKRTGDAAKGSGGGSAPGSGGPQGGQGSQSAAQNGTGGASGDGSGEVLDGLGIPAPQDTSGGIWDRFQTRMSSKPIERGILGNTIALVAVTINTIDLLRVEPEDSTDKTAAG